MSPFNVLLPALLFLTPVLAHFKLDYPTSRGYDVNNETQFCGGFPNVTTRNPWYLEDGKVKIEGLEDGAKVNVSQFEQSCFHSSGLSNCVYLHEIAE